MATLAEEFLADFEEEEEEEEEEQEEEQVKVEGGAAAGAIDAQFAVPSLPGRSAKKEKADVEMMDADTKAGLLHGGHGRPSADAILQRDAEDIHQVTKLLFDGRLADMLEKITTVQMEDEDGSLAQQKRAGTLEQSSEYKLILEANEMLSEIREEILTLHRFLRGLYQAKFAELETLVLNPLDYARVVLRIANQKDISGLQLDDLLKGPTVMVVKMASTASTSSQTQIPAALLAKVREAADGMLRLDDARSTMLRFIESKMSVISPNVSALVGTDIAAKMIGLAGGLVPLSRIPAGTVQMLGSRRKALEGFSLQSAVKHVGFIYDCEVIQSCPEAHRKKAIRVVSAKATLAARVDGYGQSPDGSVGKKYRKEIEAKIEKWQEPPPAKKIKALPAPDDKPRPTRGGARARKMKQRYQVTEVRKLKSRLGFGVEEQTIGNSEEGMGMLTASNRLRLQIVEDKRLKKLAKKYQLDAKKGKRKEIRSGVATSGLASSLAFTPVQGIELVDPELAKKRVAKANQTYFSNQAAFARVKKESAAKLDLDGTA